MSVKPSARAIELGIQTEKDPRLVELILGESREVLRTRPGTIIVEHRLGFMCANAGIDHSNVAGIGDSKEEWVLLLLANPDRAAEELRQGIQSGTGKRIGILIIDSHGRAWRNGTVGAAIGALVGLGLIAETESDLAGALDAYTKAVAREPDDFAATTRLARAGGTPPASPSSAPSASPAASPAVGG